MRKTTLEKLAGLHILSGVETGVIQEDHYSAKCNYISFMLDGKRFTAVEDPSDGYRSCMDYLTVGKGTLNNNIPDTQVFILIDENVAKFYASENNQLVLEVGTDYQSAWYPCFVASFRPENLPVNKKRKRKEKDK